MAAEHVVAAAEGERLRLMVRQPPGPPPARGFPVLYAFDGAESFDALAGHAAALPEPPLLVAIAYPAGEGTVARRIRDLTPPGDPSLMPARPNGEPWPPLGGGDALLETIERTVKPLVAARYPVDPDEATLFGHSLGGLLTLHALMSRPGAYRRYVASSPSLWAYDRRPLRDMAAFLAAPASAAPVSLVLTVGGEEETMRPDRPRPGVPLDIWERWMTGNRMIENARALAALVGREGAGRIALSFEILPGDDHHTARFAAARIAVETAAQAWR